MTKKNIDLINEGVVRRWGKLANLNKLTESFIDSTVVVSEDEEELEVELPADESEGLEDAELEMPAEMDAEAPVAAGPEVALDQDQVEALTKAFATALSQVTGVEVAVEADSDDEMPADELEAPAPEMGDEMPADELEPELGDEEMAFNRNDKNTEEEDADQVTEASATETADTDDTEEDKADEDNSSDLTEAVLKRVIERLLATK